MKLATHIYDFLVFLSIYLLVYLSDVYVYSEYNLNSKFFSLFAFLIIYQIVRDFIRILGKKHLFGGFVNYGRIYALMMSLVSWIGYLLFMRLQKF